MSDSEFIAAGVDPGVVRESFDQVSRGIAAEVEHRRRTAERREARAAWNRRRPIDLDRTVLDRLGLTPELFKKYEADEREARTEHYARFVKPDVEDPVHPGALPPRPRTAETGAPGSPVQPIPYAVMGVASDRALLEASFPDAENHNPHTVLLLGKEHQKLYINLWGSGSGMYDFSFAPEFDSVRWQEVLWFFLHIPQESVSGWVVDPWVWLHGSFACWADDKPLWSSKYARVKAEASIEVLPLGEHFNAAALDRNVTVIDHHGQHVDESAWGGWLPNFGWISPQPSHYLRPHWIIVRVAGECQVRGYSHALLNFANGCSTSGSVEAGTYKETEYGVYVVPTVIQLPPLHAVF